MGQRMIPPRMHEVFVGPLLASLRLFSHGLLNPSVRIETVFTVLKDFVVNFLVPGIVKRPFMIRRGRLIIGVFPFSPRCFWVGPVLMTF